MFQPIEPALVVTDVQRFHQMFRTYRFGLWDRMGFCSTDHVASVTVKVRDMSQMFRCDGLDFFLFIQHVHPDASTVCQNICPSVHPPLQLYIYDRRFDRMTENFQSQSRCDPPGPWLLEKLVHRRDDSRVTDGPDGQRWT